MRAQFAKIDVQFANIDAQFKEVRIESQHMAARFHNSTLKNPAMRIVPVFILDSFREIASPDSKNFPRNAKEFYSMCDNPNERLTRMLHYLVGFYDVQLDHQELSHSDSEAIDDVSPGQRVETTWVAVEMLESILGLNEENFIKFKERAAALVHRSPQPPIKRPNPPSTSIDEGKQKLASRPSQRAPTKPKSFGSGEEDQIFGENSHRKPLPHSKECLPR